MVSRSAALTGVGAVVGVVVVLGAVGGALVTTGVLAQPTVDSTEYEWGEVRGETTEIRTRVAVTNPNPVGVPGVIGVSYTARLNDVTLAEGTASGVGFGPGTNTVELTTEMENDRIADWWVTHVNGGEQSELAVDAEVSGPGFTREVPARSSTVETDIAGGFAAEGEQTVRLTGEPFVVLKDQRAGWGEANETATPLRFRADVENVHDYPVTLSGVEYVVTMNGVELGRGQQAAEFAVRPGEREGLDVTVALDTPKMADWWAEHVRDGEASNLSVRMYGVVERDGERTRVPLRLYDTTLRVETDVLGGGSTEVRPVERPDGPSFDRPEITDTHRSWGRVTDDATALETSATLDTPDGRFADLLRMEIDQRVTINDVEVADDRTTVSDLERGEDAVTLTTHLDTDAVPRWWARHVNRGEQSEVVAAPRATVDVGATRVDADLATRTDTVETDMLSGMNGERDEEVRAGGRTVLTVERVDSRWGRATPETAPIETETTVTNEAETTLEITDVRYVVTLNGVVLADRTAPDTYVVGPNARETLDLTMRLDNGKMDEWWVTHVRDGEQSRLDVTVEATVRTQFGRERVELESLGQSATVETDIADD